MHDNLCVCMVCSNNSRRASMNTSSSKMDRHKRGVLTFSACTVIGTFIDVLSQRIQLSDAY